MLLNMWHVAKYVASPLVNGMNLDCLQSKNLNLSSTQQWITLLGNTSQTTGTLLLLPDVHL
jgi:hypothetical protein